VDYPSVIPMIAYEDGAAAMDWLARAFGFNERTRMSGPDGLIMLASPTPDYQSPRRHRANCATAAKWSEVPYIIDGVLVYVEDVDAHCAQARSSGATLLSEPESTEHGKLYRAEDVEGHRWMFMER
jgi:uncharacterized glyoxalase superfamily protein PhnB